MVETVYYSALHYAAKAKKSEEKAAEYLQQVSGKVTAVEGSIGDIGFAPFGIDEVQNKRRYLNGQVISQTQFETFTNKVKEAVALYPNIATTEENWQAEVTNSKLGQCGKFVIDDTLGTIRLPKVINIQGLQDLALMGSIKAESLPNITGTVTQGNGYSVSWNSTLNDNGGALYGINATTMCANASGISNTYSNGFGLDASRSSSTYQDNAPVQQEAIQYPYFIQVATGTEESVDVTREIELNNPFSLLDYKWSEYEITNASWLISNGVFHSGVTYVAVYELLLKLYSGAETKEGVSVKLSTEAYEDTDFVLNTSDTTFRLPIKVKLASGNAVVGNGMSLGLYDGNRYFATAERSTDDLSLYSSGYGSVVGTALTGSAAGSDNKSIGVTTDPTKSGLVLADNDMYLYFYVGETIQDVNVIAAGQVLTEVAKKTDSVQAAAASMPSGKYIDLTLGASGTSYTAPANGWFVLGGSGSWFSMYNVNNLITTMLVPRTDTPYPRGFIPAGKGDIIRIEYVSFTADGLRFIYAEGDQ